MPRLPNDCPSYTEPVAVSRLSCSSCGIQLEGNFPFPPLLFLPEDALRFVIESVRASGSLKDILDQIVKGDLSVRGAAKWLKGVE
jgi:hypothetical protein